MKISKKQLLEGFNIMSRLNTNNFESPLYDPKKFKPKSPFSEPEVRTVQSAGGDYPVSFETSPTIQQRLKLKSGDTSLSAKERGVPKDRSEDLLYKPEKDKLTHTQRTWFNPNYALGAGQLKSVTYYETKKKKEPSESDDSLSF